MSTLGKAVIEFSADTAKFQGDVGRAAVMFDKSMKSMTRGVTDLITSWQGIAAALAAGGGFTAFIADSVRTRGALDDLADTIGGSVVNLDGLRRQWLISGVAFDAGSAALVKLARNLQATDDEGKAAAQALKAIGINADEIRGKNIAEATLEIARAFAKFEDGGGKAAAAVALMGREGARQLPFLKDLAEAGELAGRITAQQAAQADRLEKQMRALRQAFVDSKEGLASELIPALARFAEQMEIGIKLAGSFGSAMMLFGTSGGFSTPAEQIRDQASAIEELNRSRETLAGLPGYAAQLAKIDAQIEAAKKRLEFAKFLQRQSALAGRTGPEFLDVRDLQALAKPALQFSPQKLAVDKAFKDSATEAERIARQIVEGEEQAATDVREAWEAYTKLQLADQARAAEAQKRMWADVFKSIDDEQERAIEEGAQLLKSFEDEEQKAAELARDLGFTFSSAFENAIVGGKKFSEILRSIEQDIIRLVTRELITAPFSKALTAAIRSSGIFSNIGETLRSGAGDLFPWLLSGAAGTAARAADLELLGVGLPTFQHGTDYVPRTGLALIHQGEAIVPARENIAGRGITINNVFNVSGAVDRRSRQQIATEVGLSVQQAVYRNT